MAPSQDRGHRPACGLQRCGHSVLPHGEGPVRASAPTNDRDGREHSVYGWSRLASSGLLHPEPQAKAYHGADIDPPCIGLLNLLVDSTGIKFLGDGEWLARKHGTQRRRQYRKVHLGMDTATGDIRAVEFTSSDKGDSPVLPHLLDQIPPDEQIGTVTGDGAFDTRRCHSAILERGGTAIIPIRKSGRRWRENCPAAKARNEILKATQRLGRAAWKRWSGYHTRSRIEAKMKWLKSFGERIASRDPDRQTAEVQIRVAIMNRFNALGTAEVERVA